MSYPRVCLTRATAKVVLPCLAVFLFARSAAGQSGNNDYIFLVASGFLCDSGDSSSCPAVVKSADSSSYEMSGVGTFNTKSKLVTATGAFTHKFPNGNSLETGIWMANELVSFDSYGIAPGARTQAGSVFGPPQFGPQPFGPRPMLMFSGSMPAGGLAVLRIQLLPMWGPARTAVLQVNCALGKVPDEHPTDGITLSFERGGGKFDQEISGSTMFVLTRAGANPAPKLPTAEAEPNPAPADVQQ